MGLYDEDLKKKEEKLFEELKREVEYYVNPFTNNLTALERDIVRNRIRYAEDEEQLHKALAYASETTGKIIFLDDIKKELKKTEIEYKQEKGEDIYKQDYIEKAEELFGEPKPIFQSLGCGVHNGIRYIGTIVYDDGKQFNAIITNEPRYYVGTEIKNLFDLNYKFDFDGEILEQSISNDIILKYLRGEFDKFDKLNIKEIFTKIRDKNAELMDYHDDRINDVIACDIISDHHLPVFDSKGLSYWKADRDSGKTKQLEVYAQLTFNPLQVGNVSPASLFRIVASTKATPLVDNLDNLSEEYSKAINQYMQLCYKRGGKYSRVEDVGKSRRSRTYDVFSSFKFNNIIGIDETTLSRCNEFPLLKTTSEKGKLKVNPKDAFWSEIRNQLYISGLKDYNLVKESYENLKVDLNNRDLEISAPILAVAKLVDNETYNRVLSYFKDVLRQRKIRDIAEKWDYLLLKLLIQKINDEPKWIKAKDLSNEIADELLNKESKDYEKKKHSISIYLGKFIRSIPLWKSNGRLVNGITEYLFKKEDVEKVIRLKEYDDLLPQTTLLNSTYSTNSINSTYSTNPTESGREGRESRVSGDEIRIEEVLI